MPTQPLHVFFCYAPQDEEACKALEAHLALLVRQGYITSWSHRSIGGGADRRAEIDRQMDQADLILLLVSADLLASDRLYDLELRRALQRQAERPEDVLGVLLRPCDWKHGEFAAVEMLPHPDDATSDARPLSLWESRDEALQRVAEVLRRRAQRRTGAVSLNPPPAHLPSAPLG